MSESREEQAGGEDFAGIATQWSLVFLAHRGSATVAGPARNELVLKYRRAIRNYLGAMLRDDHSADELTRNVIVRLLSGDFAAATPDKGRFRNYLKVAVRNMARAHWRDQQREGAAGLDAAALAAVCDDAQEDTVWNYDWRSNILISTWAALKKYQQANPKNLFYTLLRIRSENPELDSAAIARRLEEQGGPKQTAANVRQQLHRARFRFAQLIIEEVAGSLDWPLPDQVEEELIDLGLIKYVRDFLPPDWKDTGVLYDPHEGPAI